MEQTKEQGEKLVADITVSHGFFVDVMAGALGYKYTYLCDYCATTSYKISVNPSDAEPEITLINASYSDYVQTI